MVHVAPHQALATRPTPFFNYRKAHHVDSLDSRVELVPAADRAQVRTEATPSPADADPAIHPRCEQLEDRVVMSVAAEEQLFIYELNRAWHDPVAYQLERSLLVSTS
jgi:hypothetical protein